uniref:Phosphomannomutase n=2 Tax=Aegilops tauschii subsp. strangulata TaxID=200361 RepID=A0A453ILY2_AEGTS
VSWPCVEGGRRDRGGVRRIWIGDAKLTFSVPRILLHLLPATPAVLYHVVVARRCASSLLRSSFSRRTKMVASAARKNAGVLALFDVDGTLTAPRKEVTPEMLEFMKRLRENVTVGVVGGSDLVKISEQLGKSVITDYDYVFSENGLVAHKDGKLIGTQSLKTYLGDDQLKEFINFTLHYIADLDIPIKRGTFIEFRSGMINVSPIGRNCSQEERDDFEKYDKVQIVL